MRKIMSILCAVMVLLALLSGCIKTPDLTVFNAWVTDNGFLPGMSEKTFAYNITNYTYLGKNLDPKDMMSQDDDTHSSGDGFWGMESKQTTKNGTVHAYHNFYVRKNLDNLQYPGGIKIGESREECLEKLGLVNTKTNVKDVKIGNKTCEMRLSNEQLVYTETYDWIRKNDDVASVTRTVMLKFSNDALSEVGVTVSEKYPE